MEGGKYIGEKRERKNKLGDRDGVYCQQIWHPKYQQLKVERHLRLCSNGKFRIFLLLKIVSQNKSLRRGCKERSYETRFQQKFKTKLNKLE